jgi:hypothetical protein
MRSLKYVFSTLILCVSLSVSNYSSAATIMVDLNDFYLDGVGTVSLDGISSSLEEDAILVNDPFFGDPGLSVPHNPVSLSFFYDFTEFDDDEFYAWLWDDATGDEIEYWYVDTSSSGVYSIDLTGLDSSVNLLGLEFGINVYGSYGSQAVDINNVNFETATVPEPHSLLLFAMGLIVLFGSRKRVLIKI